MATSRTPHTALAPAQAAKVAKLNVRGHDAADIAKLTGMSRSSVYRALAVA